MNPRIPRSATRNMKSVVVVCDRVFNGDYCTGFVAMANTSVGTSVGTTSPSATLVIAPSSFVTRWKHINISFFDGVISRAKVVNQKGPFCLLTTNHHRACEEVSWLEYTSYLNAPAPTYILPPISRTNTCYWSTYTLLECAESYHLVDHTRLQVDSSNYFLVSCDFLEVPPLIGESRLVGAPVFAMGTGSMKSKTMGVIFMDYHLDRDIKVAIRAEFFKEIVDALLGKQTEEEKAEDKKMGRAPPPPPPMSPPRRKRRKVAA